MNQNQIVMTRGDSRTFTLTVTDSDGDPYDLTDASVWFTVGSDPLFQKTVGDGITVSAPLTGTASILVSPEDTEDVSDTRTVYRYDVQVELSDGTVRTPVRGLFVIVPDVTEDT